MKPLDQKAAERARAELLRRAEILERAANHYEITVLGVASSIRAANDGVWPAWIRHLSTEVNHYYQAHPRDAVLDLRASAAAYRRKAWEGRGERT